ATIASDVELEVGRNGRSLTVATTMARLAEEQTATVGMLGEGAPRTDGGPRGGRIFGLALSELDASLREEYQIEPHVHGLVVMAVDATAGPMLQPGDVIEEMAFQPVDSMATARAIAERAAISQHAIVAKVNRDGHVTYRRLVGRSS